MKITSENFNQNIRLTKKIFDYYKICNKQTVEISIDQEYGRIYFTIITNLPWVKKSNNEVEYSTLGFDYDESNFI